MSKSRLEKFLYALYSLDSSDLPTPLSRIEELYKCLVTGEEAPTFEPLSRVEKYLMTILGVYDVNSLPNPLSRVEVLLYKLATGDDNLDDVESFLSEHEELLAEIIRNGGVGGNIDIEYILYTLSTEFNALYNTAEKPVKSAILKGNTLVNLQEKGTWVISDDNLAYYSPRHKASVLKTNTKYIIYFTNLPSTAITCYFDYGINNRKDILDNRYSIFTTGTDISKDYYIHIYTITGGSFTTEELANCHVMIIEYQEGMENWDIPYFEGMQLVKMPVLTTTGKNLFDGRVGEDKKRIISTGVVINDSTFAISEYISVSPNKKYICNKSGGYGSFYDSDKKLISTFWNSAGALAPQNAHYVRISFEKTNMDDLQFEENSTSTSYEPFKSNILTVNEEVELRGIGNVKDELNLLTGELTQRIGEIVLDGSEKWFGSTVGSAGTFMRFHTIVQDAYLNEQGSGILCDRFTSISHGNWNTAIEGIHSKHTEIHINIPTSNLESNDASGFKKWLSSNPVTVCYTLATESIKTVDLSVVDQDGNNTKLSTFDDITHVTLSSEGLIPEAELEVATKNEEDLEDSIVYTAYTLSEEFNTLYNTAEKPVKSAILKGQTLVNLFDTNLVTFNNNQTVVENGIITIPFRNHLYNSFKIPKAKCTMFKPSTTYTLIVDMIENNGQPQEGETEQAYSFCIESYDYSNSIVKSGSDGVYTCIIPHRATGRFIGTFVTHDKDTYDEKIDGIIFTLLTYYNATQGQQKLSIVILEGDYTNIDIPYFEGMQSVKMPVLKTVGKNLFNESVNLFNVACSPKTSNSWKSSAGGNRKSIRIRVKPNTKYTISKVGGDRFAIFTHNSDFDVDKTTVLDKLIVSNTELTTYTLTTPATAQYLIAYLQIDSDDLTNIQVVEGEITPYEPYKSNILTVNEEVELRGVGDVKDELNLITGELTQRIGGVVLDGSKINEYTHQTIPSTHLGFSFTNESGKTYKNSGNYLISTSIFDVRFLAWSRTQLFYGQVNKNLLDGEDVASIKKFFSNNDVIVNLVELEPTVKTVDLSVVDQDGNNTKLKTFDDITHVTLSSGGLIPEAELEVAEKVPEVAASMLTISREQEVINTTTNEQSENVDSTMIATTEIYEELL